MEILTFSDDKHPNYWLSNYYPFKTTSKLEIVYESQIYQTSEHLYQALKFRCETEDEKNWRNLIRTAPTPNVAKYLGNLWTYTRYGWQVKYSEMVKKYKNNVRLIGDISDPQIRYKIMFKTISIKFNDEYLKTKLLSTEDIVLGEISGGYWGIKGENRLGEILMIVREKLKNN